MFDDQRLYKGEKTQQDDEVMKSVSDTSKAQKNWPRKHIQIDKNENYEPAMMCWESLEDSDQESKERKMIGQDKETNDDKEKQDDKMDNEEHIQSTVYTGNQLKIPVEEFKLGVDNASTLTTQETLVKNLVYITNIQEEKQGTLKDAGNDGKNPSEQDNKKPQRLVGQAHAVIEPGKSIPIWKFHQMTGPTGEHLLRTTAENMGIKLTGKL